MGEYSNFSIFDLASNDELHDLLSGLPLFPYMDIAVTPLATHPSDVAIARDRPLGRARSPIFRPVSA